MVLKTLGVNLDYILSVTKGVNVKFRKNTLTSEGQSTKLPNKYKVWINDKFGNSKKRFNSYSNNGKTLVFVIIFAVIGSIILQIVKAEDDYGSIMSSADQLVLRYETTMAHPLVQNDFAQGSPPTALLYGNGLMLCSAHAAGHSDSQVSPLMSLKQRQLSPSEITVMVDKIRSLKFDDLLVRTLPDTLAPPAGATPSFSLITSAGERRATLYLEEKSDSFTAIADYINSECAKAKEDFYPDDVVLETIKTAEVADTTVAKIPDLPGTVSKNTNEVQSIRLTGADAKKAKDMVTKGNKIFKTSDGKKIKVRVLPKIPEFKSPNPYKKSTNKSGVASAEPYRKVRFLYVIAADQAVPASAQTVVNDLAATLPVYYRSQLGKTFSTSSVEIVRAKKTVAEYQTCPNGSTACTTFYQGKYAQEMATYLNLLPEFYMTQTNTIIMHSWSNDGICIGLGGPVNSTDNVNVADYGFATYSSTNCWPEAIHQLGAHEGGHGFGLVHTCDTTMMDTCGYTKAPAYGSPLHTAQAALLRDYSPYFNGPLPTPQDPAPILSGTTYIAITPARILDSRSGASTVDGQYLGIGTRPAGSVTEVQVAGRAGVPADALSASLNITSLSATTDGYMTVYPCGIGTPNTSNVNYTTGSTVANFVISKLGSGKVCVYTSGATGLLIDVSGAFPAGSGASYTNVVPSRLMDTRIGGSTVDGQFTNIGQLAAGSITQLQVAGRAGISSTASAVSMNVTILNPLANGFATVFPCDSTAPNTSSVNYTTGKVVSNAVISKLGNGKVCIYTNIATGLLVDANGSFNTVTAYSSILPARILDSRVGASTIDGQYLGIGTRPAGSVTEVQVAGRAGVKGDALVAALNITAVNPASAGYMTVYPCGISTPNTSNVNYTTSSSVANFVISKLGSGKVCVFTSSATDLLVDVNGAFVVADVQQLALSAPPATQAPVIAGGQITLQTCPTGTTGTYPNCVTTVPPPVCSGITVYKDANYLGTSQNITVGKYATNQITLGDNAVSSAKIPTGCKLTLYQGSGYTGATQVLTSDWVGFNKDPWNDKTSSLEVSLADVIASGSPKTCLVGSVVLFKDAAYGGISQTLSNGSYNASQITVGDNRLSSVKVPAGCKVILYQSNGFSGATKVLTGNWTSVLGDPWNDITSSLEVRNLE